MGRKMSKNAAKSGRNERQRQKMTRVVHMHEQLRFERDLWRCGTVRRDLIEYYDVQPRDEYACSAGNAVIFPAVCVFAPRIHRAKEARERRLSKGRLHARVFWWHKTG